MKRLVGCALLALLFLCVIAPVARADASAPSQQPGSYIQIAMLGPFSTSFPTLSPQDIAEDPGLAERFMFEKIEKAKKSYPTNILTVSILIFAVLLIYCFTIFDKIKKEKKFKFIIKITLIIICIIIFDTILIDNSRKKLVKDIIAEDTPYIQELREKQSKKFKAAKEAREREGKYLLTQPTKNPPPQYNQNSDEFRNLEDRIREYKRSIESLVN